MGKIKNQAGFSIIEWLVVIVVVAIIALGSYYVWHHHKTDKAKTATSSSSKSATKSATAGSSSSSTSSSSSSSTSSTFEIPELGIKLVNVPASIAGLTDYEYASYSGVDSNNTVTTPINSVALRFSTQVLTNEDAGCSAKTGSSIGILVRNDGTYVDNGPVEASTFVKQFNGFYITYGHPEAACSNSSSVDTLQESQTATFQAFATDAANVQAL